MADALFARVTLDGVEVEEGAPEPDKVIAGEPRFRTWNVEERNGLFCGTWEATPGKWHCSYDEWEYCHILSGRSIITHEDGEVWTVEAGDGFVLRPGFKGTWEVVETTRKQYVIRL